MGGKNARCDCGTVLTIPRPQTQQAVEPTLIATCSRCLKNHEVPESMAGRSARCECGAVLKIPVPGPDMSQMLEGLADVQSSGQPQQKAKSEWEITAEKVQKTGDALLAEHMARQQEQDELHRWSFDHNRSLGIYGGAFCMFISVIWFLVSLSFGRPHFLAFSLFSIGLISVFLTKLMSD